MTKTILTFSDNESFYDKLKEALKAGEEVEVTTNFERYADLPEKLKGIFELERHRSGKWMNLTSGMFVPGAAVAAGLNTKSLVVLGTTAAGAAAGALAGPFGAVVGAGVGIVAGTVVSTLMDSEHEVEIEVDAKGKLKVKIRPAKKR